MHYFLSVHPKFLYLCFFLPIAVFLVLQQCLVQFSLLYIIFSSSYWTEFISWAYLSKIKKKLVYKVIKENLSPYAILFGLALNFSFSLYQNYPHPILNLCKQHYIIYCAIFISLFILYRYLYSQLHIQMCDEFQNTRSLYILFCNFLFSLIIPQKSPHLRYNCNPLFP